MNIFVKRSEIASVVDSNRLIKLGIFRMIDTNEVIAIDWSNIEEQKQKGVKRIEARLCLEKIYIRF